MSLLEELHPASYKGIFFLVDSSTLSGGTKFVKHSFPGSSRQTIESLGVAPRSVQLRAVIVGKPIDPQIGEEPSTDYFQRRDAFISVLESDGSGVLIHPFYGRLDNYKAVTFTVNETMTELGEAKVNVTFEIDDDIGTPTLANVNVNTIAALNDSFFASTNADIANNVKVTNNFIGNFASAVNKLNDVVDTINEKTKVVQAVADEISNFSLQISNFSANVIALTQQPQALADNITTAFTSISNIYPSFESTFVVLKGFFDFGDNDIEIAPTTAALNERKKNNDVLNQSIQALALSAAYAIVSQIEFSTVQNIEDAAEILENQYIKIIDNEVDGLDDTTLSVLSDLRSTTNDFFEQSKLNASQLVDINVRSTSARLLSYKLYGNTEKAEEIINVNSVDDVSFIEGSVKVLSS